MATEGDESTELMLRMEIARLLKAQREVLIQELETPWFRVMEYSAEGKAATARAAVSTVEFLRNPLENDFVQNQLHALASVASSVQQLMTAPSAERAPRAEAAEESDVRSVSKIDMLERQLQELRELIAAQTAAQMAALQAPQQQVRTLAATTSAPVITQQATGANAAVAPSTPAPAPVARPRIADMMAEAKSLQLRRTAASGAATTAAAAKKHTAPAGSGIEAMLRNAMASRFGSLHPASPESTASVEDDDSSFGSPGSPRSRSSNARRSLVSGAAVIAGNRRALRMAAGEAGERRHSTLLRRAGAAADANGVASSGRDDTASTKRGGGLVAPMPRAIADDASHARPRRSVAFAMQVEAIETSSPSQGAEGADENVQPPAPVGGMLAAIKGFNVASLRRTKDAETEPGASVTAEPPAALSSSRVQTSGLTAAAGPASIASAIGKVTLRKTGARLA